MNTTTTDNNRIEIQLFDDAFAETYKLYGPMGFGSAGQGNLRHLHLNIPLLPFYERCDESPLEFALRSAFEAGRVAGLSEAQDFPT